MGLALFGDPADMKTGVDAVSVVRFRARGYAARVNSTTGRFRCALQRAARAKAALRQVRGW